MTIPTSGATCFDAFFHGAVEQNRAQMEHFRAEETICAHCLLITPGGGVNSGKLCRKSEFLPPIYTKLY